MYLASLAGYCRGSISKPQFIGWNQKLGNTITLPYFRRTLPLEAWKQTKLLGSGSPAGLTLEFGSPAGLVKFMSRVQPTSPQPHPPIVFFPLGLQATHTM